MMSDPTQDVNVDGPTKEVQLVSTEEVRSYFEKLKKQFYIDIEKKYRGMLKEVEAALNKIKEEIKEI